MSRRAGSLPGPARSLVAALSLAISGLCALGLSATSVWAQEDTTEEDRFSGQFVVGWRSVDVDGREGKYRQHVDLDDGPRLFELELEVRPEESFADVLSLRLDHLGGDPFEGIDFDLRRFGQYRFHYERRKSRYVYDDLILPHELASPALSNAGDFHTWDFERTRDSVSLSVQASPRASFDLGLDRSTKRGESTTVFDIQRDEFELEAPIDETMDGVDAVFGYAWDKATLQVQESYEEYQNAREVFLPGLSLGENRDNATVLDFYFLEQPIDLSSHRHSVRLDVRPSARLSLLVAALVGDDELDFTVHERAQGTTFRGDPYTLEERGQGDVSRDLERYDLELSWLLTSRLALYAGAHRRDLEQEGVLAYGVDSGTGAWDLETTGLEAGLELAASRELSLSAGVVRETRDVAHGDVLAVDSEIVETDHTGFVASVTWRPTTTSRLLLSVEEGSYDDPFTLASPTDRRRYRAEGKVERPNGLFVSGQWTSDRSDNDNSGWRADLDRATLRGGLRRDGFEASVGFSRFDTDRRVDQQVVTAPGFQGGLEFLFPVLFESDAELVDGRFRWRLQERFQLGGDLRLYENEGDFALERDDLRLWLRVDLPARYLLHLGLRSIDYEEPVRRFNDYDAVIAELGVGYRF